MSRSYWFLSTRFTNSKILEFDYYVSIDKINTYKCMITGIYLRQDTERGSPYTCNKRGVELDLMIHVYTLQIYVIAMII